MSSSSTPTPAAFLRRANPVALIGRYLPKGWPDFIRQLAIFASFDVAYELSRGLATGRPALAFAHARDVVHVERMLDLFHERTVQQWVLQAPGFVEDIANWTYFNCQFTISISFLIWVYIRRNDAYAFIRNTVLCADFIAVIGYVFFPTAPPRMLHQLGFVDTLSETAVNHNSKLVAVFANPYAAMPSLHTAYAIVLGVSGVLLVRPLWLKAVWALYPGLVIFSIVATANHFFLDAMAGSATLLIAFSMSLGFTFLRRRSSARPVFKPALETGC